MTVYSSGHIYTILFITYIRLHAHKYIQVHTYVCMYLCVNVCVGKHMFKWVYKLIWLTKEFEVSMKMLSWSWACIRDVKQNVQTHVTGRIDAYIFVVKKHLHVFQWPPHLLTGYYRKYSQSSSSPDSAVFIASQ